MNGMVTNSWPYVIAAFAVTWLVLIGYAVRLRLMPKARRTSLPTEGTHA